VDLEPDDATEPAARQLRLDRLQEIAPLVLLDLEVGVSGDPEHVMLDDLHPGEQLTEVEGDDLLQRHETLAVGHHHEAGQDRGDLDAGEPGLSRVAVPHENRQIEREVRDVRERVGRVHRQRGDDREHPGTELLVEIDAVVFVEGVVVAEPDSRLGHQRCDLVEEQGIGPLVLVGDERADPLELLGRGHPVGRRDRTPSATCSFSPATRTMKNSSRFDAQIARNRVRSSSGIDRPRPGPAPGC
jgi:hypothetical protein